MKKQTPLPGSNPGRPRDRREYSPLYYNDLADNDSTVHININRRPQFVDIPYHLCMRLCGALKFELFFMNPIAN